ncbi:MAG: hypothetical protein COB46_02760 [Rhodospirillaceae bacterium]|nr:MAG: hypothetical protein COB46_02760 [Rhodospirillaceae bacterium]
MTDTSRIQNIFLDERTVVNRTPQVEHERKVALFDLIEDNSFGLIGGPDGPYVLHLSIEENRLAFDVRDVHDKPLKRFILALSPFRSIVREYLMVCDSYYTAIKSSSPSQIEAIDMGRRGLHNDGSDILKERLKSKVELDKSTARRLFTLVCVLHIKG